jgi:hypothetical protein
MIEIVILILCIFNTASLIVIGAALYRNSETVNNIAGFLTSMPPIRKKRLQTLVTAEPGELPGVSEGLIEP